MKEFRGCLDLEIGEERESRLAHHLCHFYHVLALGSFLSVPARVAATLSLSSLL
jgi:hypothetical protein